MFFIITENLIGTREIKMIGLGIVIGIMYYSINYVCSMLYDHGCDIFGKFNKKKKNSKKKLR
jgi:hypothetical protein